MENIRKLGSERYRSGQSSLQSRVNKRLLKKYNWFRQRNNINVENDEEKSDPNKKKWSHYRRRKERIVAMESDEKNEKEKKGNPAKSVLFVPNTENSVLATDIRETIQSLRPWTLMNIKVVERSGDKLQDLLCKSNPWDNQDCERENCFSCETAVLKWK